MTKKTSLTLAIAIFSILLISIIWYFGINYLMDKNFQENTIQCSNDTEKRRQSLKNSHTLIDENFYSKKLKTCIITWVTWNTNQGMFSGDYIIKELYTWKSLDTFSICNTKDECNLMINYNTDKIPELIWIKEEELRSICSSETKDNLLKQYCTLIKNWDRRKEWKEAAEKYR